MYDKSSSTAVRSTNTLMMAGFSDPAPIRSDLRAAPRTRLNLPGRLKLQGAEDVVPCRVVDHSINGAQIELSSEPGPIRWKYARLPAEVTLHIVFDRTEVPCRIVWKRDLAVGLRFTAAPRRV